MSESTHRADCSTFVRPDRKCSCTVTVPKAPLVLTPAQYGAFAPPGNTWPLNQGMRQMYYLNNLYPTIQGEGALVGTPMTIVRLQGCPVGCVFCDTPESWFEPAAHSSMLRTSRQIAADVQMTGLKWALVTGGEPTWHNLESLTEELEKVGIRCALETAGVYDITGIWQWITLSPKPAGNLPLLTSNLLGAQEIKWLVGKQSDVDDLITWLYTTGKVLYTRHKPAVISLQPISCNKRATEICLGALMKHPEWRLSLQTHKMMDIA